MARPLAIRKAFYPAGINAMSEELFAQSREGAKLFVAFLQGAM